MIFIKEQQLDALLENINYEISLLSNASAFIKQVFSDISWVGFYLCQDNQLILGPFQGKTACTLIPFNKGVCGACLRRTGWGGACRGKGGDRPVQAGLVWIRNAARGEAGGGDTGTVCVCERDREDIDDVQRVPFAKLRLSRKNG